MKLLLPLVLLIAFATPAFADEDTQFWNDGEPEVILGAYFDEAGRDTVFEGELPDSLTVYIMMWNGSERGEGGIRALEYRLEIPDGFLIMSDELPDHSKLAMGTVQDGFTQAVTDLPGDGLLINTIKLYKVGEVPYDARLRILPHPVSGYLRYVHGIGSPENVAMHLLEAQDAIYNPKLTKQGFKPIRSH